MKNTATIIVLSLIIFGCNLKVEKIDSVEVKQITVFDYVNDTKKVIQDNKQIIILFEDYILESTKVKAKFSKKCRLEFYYRDDFYKLSFNKEYFNLRKNDKFVATYKMKKSIETWEVFAANDSINK